MKLRELVVFGGVLFVPGLGHAGGLFLPGSGAVSTSRAGAAVASADDGEALSINPAGLAKAHGTTITISAAIISYAMEFTRRGSYDPISDADVPYEGQPFGTVKNDPSLPLGVGSYQPVPVIAIVSDLGGRVPNLHVAAGLYAPNAYPFRNMRNGYTFNGDPNAPPPPTRYDVLEQDAAILFPSVGVSYRILPELDVGARFSYGFAHLKSTLAIWGTPGNYEEAVGHDAEFTADATDTFVPTWALGVTYRPAPAIELAANYSSQSVIRGKGNAVAQKGPDVGFAGMPVTIGPVFDENARCAPGGTFEEQKVCVDLALPMSATIGGRYKFIGADGVLKGDLELDVGWENWGKRCEGKKDFADGCTSPGQYRVVADAAVYTEVNGQLELQFPLQDNIVDHRLQDTYSLRLGGSYVLPVGSGEAAYDNSVVLRGGVAYDTQAAEEGWLRADFDGAARVTATLGAGYRAPRWEVNVGLGAVLEGSPSNAGTCNPQTGNTGCAADGSEQNPEDREGPDPINPLNTPEQQAESPVTQGTYKSRYVLAMVGFSTWF